MTGADHGVAFVRIAVGALIGVGASDGELTAGETCRTGRLLGRRGRDSRSRSQPVRGTPPRTTGLARDRARVGSREQRLASSSSRARALLGYAPARSISPPRSSTADANDAAPTSPPTNPASVLLGCLRECPVS